MTTTAGILWVIAAMMVIQGKSYTFGERERSNQQIPKILNGELENEDMFLENFEDTNPDKVGDKELFEADILLTDEQYEAFLTRKAIRYISYRWDEGSDSFPFVPYVFQDSVDQNDVRAGIDHWMDHTCIMFEETSNTSQPHLQFHIGSGCWSYIGQQFSNGQQISIGSGCNSLGTVVHEIGHAMGFYHEQSRSDRDDYVKINTANIIPGKDGNFGQANDNNYSVVYDYSSDMHYSGRGFTTNGGFTIATKDPLAQELIGSRSGLSHRDKILANTMYGCLDKWFTSCGISSNPCQNEGFIGVNCTCVCPTSTSGTNCETVNEEYYANLRSDKTAVITTEGSISVNAEGGGEKFTKYIIAPECKTPKLTFQTFNLYPKSALSNGYTYCYYEYLNIRTGDDLYDGDVFCGTDITSGEVFISSTGKMILFTESRYSGTSGWSAQLTFEDDPGCSSTISTTTTTGPKSPSLSPTPNLTLTTPPTTTPATTTTDTTPAPVILKCKSKKAVTRVEKGETVMFTSPKFPGNYPRKKSCGWILQKPSDGSFVINCSPFELQPKNKMGICKDFLKLAGTTYCGDNGPESVTFNRNTLKIRFHSNGKKQFKGFSCTATVV